MGGNKSFGVSGLIDETDFRVSGLGTSATFSLSDLMLGMPARFS